MRYETLDDLPLVCHYNLPEPALRVYQEAYNTAWAQTTTPDRDRVALECAWRAVREQFVKERFTGAWVRR
jgi:cation transport regulator ChaB